MKSRFSVEQIIKILREAEVSGVDIGCREHNIGRNTLYRWRQKFSGMGQKMQYSLKNLKTKTQNSRDVYRDDIGEADI